MTLAKSTSHRILEAQAHHQAGELDLAEALYREILGEDPDHADAWHLYGLLAHQRGVSETAVQMMGRAISLCPTEAAYYVNLAEAQMGLGQKEDAIASLHQALVLEPELALAQVNLANVLYEACRYEEGLLVCRAALELDADSAKAWNILGNLQEALGDHAKARDAYRVAIQRDPTSSRPWGNLAVSLERSERLSEALEACGRALELEPGNGDARLLRALLLLKSGNYEQGWAAYEDRWMSPIFLSSASPARGFSQPLWTGQDLRGRRILMHAEQGFGDTLQFIRFAPLLAQRGAEVHVECPSEMVRLFRSIPGLASVRAAGEPLPEVDFQLPFLSAPNGFGTTLETVPSEVPYLTVPDAELQAWRDRLAGKGPCVGLVWAGRPDPSEYRSRRAMALGELEPLFQVEGLTWVSLQRGAGSEQIETSGLPLLDFTSQVRDFADQAALISALDLVITIDTATAHLAGALGKPAWVFLPKPAAYQWMLHREDSPWYPTLRLFRQDEEGVWEPIVARVLEALKVWAVRLGSS